jgi:hypothetical protein
MPSSKQTTLPPPQDRLAYNLREAAAVVGVSLWVIRVAVGRSQLKAKRVGGVQIVTPEAIHAWLESLEDVTPSKSYSKAYRAKSLKAVAA